MRTNKKRSKSTLLICYDFVEESGLHGKGQYIVDIRGNNFHYRHLSPLEKVMKQNLPFKEIIITNIIKL